MSEDILLSNKDMWISQFYDAVLRIPHVRVITCSHCHGNPAAMPPWGRCLVCSNVGFTFECPSSMPELIDEIKKLEKLYHIDQITGETRAFMERRKEKIESAPLSPLVQPKIEKKILRDDPMRSKPKKVEKNKFSDEKRKFDSVRQMEKKRKETSDW